MNARTHAALIQIINISIVVLGPAFLIYTFTLGNFLPFIVLVVGRILIHFLVWALPVRCDSFGCVGEIKKKQEYISGTKARLQYSCSKCGEFYKREIFAMRSEYDSW